MNPAEARHFLALKPLMAFVRAQLETRALFYARFCLQQDITTEERDKRATRGAELFDLLTWLDSQIATADQMLEAKK